MANPLNYNDLLKSIKRSISVPDNQARYSDEDFIAFANEEINMTIVPVIKSLREEYLVYRTRLDIVPEQAGYQIPHRAMGRNVRDVLLVPDALDTKMVKLPLLSTEDTYRHDGVGDPLGFRLENDKVVLMPAPSDAGGQLELAYILSPSNICPFDEAYKITNINRVNGSVTIASAVDNNISSTQLFDFVSSREATVPLAVSVESTSFSQTTFIFSPSDIPEDVEPGDYITLAGKSPFITLPQEVHQVISSSVTCRVLEGLGDYEALQYAQTRRNAAIKAMRETLAPRSLGATKKVVNRNGLLRGKSGMSLKRT